MKTAFVPTPRYLRHLAEQAGIDPDRLLQDMNSAGIEAEIEENKALAAVIGFPGTPGLVVGRTVVIGAIGDAELRSLIQRERADGPVRACRGKAGGT